MCCEHEVKYWMFQHSCSTIHAEFTQHYLQHKDLQGKLYLNPRG